MADDLDSALSQEGYELDVRLHSAVSDVRMEDVIAFPKRLFGDGCYLQGLVLGNMILSEAEVSVRSKII